MFFFFIPLNNSAFILVLSDLQQLWGLAITHKPPPPLKNKCLCAGAVWWKCAGDGLKPALCRDCSAYKARHGSSSPYGGTGGLVVDSAGD